MSEAKAKTKRGRKPEIVVKTISVSPDVEEWLDLETVLALLKVSRSRFKAMIAEGAYPRPDDRIGNRDKWLKSTHNAHLRSRPKPEPIGNPFDRG